MGYALAEAKKAAALDETPVGAAVVSPRGEILGAAGNRVRALTDPSAHAEILAIREAARRLQSERLSNCLIMVTLEPCAMCAGAILQARLAGVVFGAADTLAGAVVSRADLLCLTPRVWSLGGVRGEECAAILSEFFAAKRGEHPHDEIPGFSGQRIRAGAGE